jgi:predicted RNase H-like nuclease
MIAIGLDGCRGGWVLVTLSAKAAPTVTAIRSIEELSQLDFDSAAIDMPIGLPKSGNRTCDMSARKYLGTHALECFLASGVVC